MKIAKLCNDHWNEANVYQEEYEKFPVNKHYKCVICVRIYCRIAYHKLTPEQKKRRESAKRERKRLKRLKLKEEQNHQLQMENPVSYKVKIKKDKKSNKEYGKEYRDGLADPYVKSTFIRDSIGLTSSDIPESVTDACRELIKLKRFLKNQKEN